MRRFSPLLGSALATALLLGFALTPAHSQSRAAGILIHVTQMMNFFPQPEEGGEYAAVHLGIYKKYGLDAPIVPFPSNALNAIPQVAAGKVIFGMAEGDEVLQARQQGIPIVVLFTIYQTTEAGMMWHAEDTSIKTLADLSNHTIIYSFGAAFWPFLMHKYHYTNLKTVNYDFTLRDFLANKKAVNQVSVTGEPYLAMKAGAKVKWANLSTAGYMRYDNVVFTTEQEIQQHPDVVRAFVKATIEGWRRYLKDPSPVNRYMQTADGSKNYPMTMEAMTFDVNQSRPLILGGDAATHGIGWMSLARWATLKRELQSVGFPLNKVDVSKVFSTAFLP